ncbi:hypothetical protein [Paenibacillus sp. YN15]|uniref:hypothetical protein n=1 Tax=Paenibacillus sp. YN15 TaxID=1742774 RepID=UPI000DCCA2ED|nr:hypothetical protein [Paenibacillus sp. YN15]RAV00173.1 hypothetical protein DQG13_14555 [Paenibacillus sp. YN15]
MANVHIENNELLLEASLEDIETIVKEAVKNIDQYKEEISVIYDKMPKFEYKHFCFYAYSTYRLLEKALNFSCDEVGHFRLIAPEEFYYAFFGVISTLHHEHCAK